MTNFRSRLISSAGQLANMTSAGPNLAWIACVLSGILVGYLIPISLGWIDGKNAAMFVPILLGSLIVAFVFGRIYLIYLLAFCWFVPIATAGVKFVPITGGITGWELLLWFTTLLALITGDIPLLRSSARNINSGMPHVRWIWIGLGMFSISSWLAISRVVPEGYGQFRYAAINIICLFLTSTNLVRSEKQLKQLVFWFFMGIIGLLVFQIGVGGYEFSSGRLFVHLISLTGVSSLAWPNKMALLASSGVPLALSLSIWPQSGRPVRVGATVLFLVLILIVFLTVSRAQIVSVFVASCIVFLVMYPSDKKAAISYFAAITIISFLLFILLSPVILPMIDFEGVFEIPRRLASFVNLFDNDSSFNIRKKLAAVALDQMRPFGIGYGYFVKLTGVWEHNLFLAVLNGSGVLGLLGLGIFLMNYYVAAIVSLKNSKGFIRVMCAGAIGSIVTLAINGLTIEVFFPTYSESSLVALAIGFAAIKLAQRERIIGLSSPSPAHRKFDIKKLGL